MDTIPVLTSILAGYFMGNLMASYLVTKWVMGFDIREHGTGNAGGSNSFMIMGWKNGLIVGIVDVLKAFLAVYIIRILYPNHQDLSMLMVISGSMAVIGHIYPFFMGFKGGKGMACFMGMCLGINPEIGFYCILFVIITTIITDYVAVGSIIAYIVLPVLLIFSPEIIFGNIESYNIFTVFAASFASAIGIWKHRNNISNILNRKETGLKRGFKKHSK